MSILSLIIQPIQSIQPSLGGYEPPVLPGVNIPLLPVHAIPGAEPLPSFLFFSLPSFLPPLALLPLLLYLPLFPPQPPTGRTRRRIVRRHRRKTISRKRRPRPATKAQTRQARGTTMQACARGGRGDTLWRCAQCSWGEGGGESIVYVDLAWHSFEQGAVSELD